LIIIKEDIFEDFSSSIFITVFKEFISLLFGLIQIPSSRLGLFALELSKIILERSIVLFNLSFKLLAGLFIIINEATTLSLFDRRRIRTHQTVVSTKFIN
jgi:hypothetical protein